MTFLTWWLLVYVKAWKENDFNMGRIGSVCAESLGIPTGRHLSEASCSHAARPCQASNPLMASEITKAPFARKLRTCGDPFCTLRTVYFPIIFPWTRPFEKDKGPLKSLSKGSFLIIEDRYHVPCPGHFQDCLTTRLNTCFSFFLEIHRN